MAADVIHAYQGNSASTTLSSSVSNTDTSFPLTSDSAFAGEGMIIVDEGAATEEYAYATGKVGSSLTIPLANRGLEGGSAQAHAAGATVKAILTAGSMNNIATSLQNAFLKTTGALDTTKVVDKNTAQTLTNKTLTTPVINGAVTGTITPPLTFYSNLNLAEGQMINGMIVPSVASNNLTVALKGMDGNAPSASNPVYVMIGGVLRAVLADLSVTKNAGTNWCNAGSAELAAKEIDYFVYLGYNATDGVVIGFSRIPYGTRYDSFSTTTTAETYCAISTITNAAAADYYNVVGRFAATLSAGAGYTWTVPTFIALNLIQRPIYETRWLTWQPVYTASGSMTITASSTTIATYRIHMKTVFLRLGFYVTTGGTASTQILWTPPISSAGQSGFGCIVTGLANGGSENMPIGFASTSQGWVLRAAGGNWDISTLNGPHTGGSWFYYIA